MTKHEEIKGMLKTFMINKDAANLSAVRNLLSMLTNELVNLEKTPQDLLSDEEVLAVVKKSIKQRKASIDQFTANGSLELAEDEKPELSFLESLLPPQMTEEEVQSVIDLVKLESPELDGGKLMGAVLKKCGANVDSAVVKRLLGV